MTDERKCLINELKPRMAQIAGVPRSSVRLQPLHRDALSMITAGTKNGIMALRLDVSTNGSSRGIAVMADATQLGSATVENNGDKLACLSGRPSIACHQGIPGSA